MSWRFVLIEREHRVLAPWRHHVAAGRARRPQRSEDGAVITTDPAGASSIARSQVASLNVSLAAWRWYVLETLVALRAVVFGRMATALVVASCGGRTTTPPESDSGPVRAPTLAAPVGLVWCGDIQCNSRSEWCCIVGGNSGHGFMQVSAQCASAEAECTDPRAAHFQCDEPADCPSGSSCCSSDQRFFCAPECPTDAIRLCDPRVRGGACQGTCYRSGDDPGEYCVSAR